MRGLFGIAKKSNEALLVELCHRAKIRSCRRNRATCVSVHKIIGNIPTFNGPRKRVAHGEYVAFVLSPLPGLAAADPFFRQDLDVVGAQSLFEDDRVAWMLISTES